MSEQDKLIKAIASLDAQRSTLGDEVVDAAINPMREKLADLQKKDNGEQRKQVTILFADVSGFTAMSEGLDAEEVSDIMNSLWQEIDAAITGHGGIIDKHIGDAIMALWGVHMAHEDDPQRAVRTALKMQQIVSQFRLNKSVSLAMRIGINTGPVMLGEVGTAGEYTAMGDAVNLASRLEHAAPVNGVLVSLDTYKHIRGIFDVSPQEPLKVKGKRELVRSYVVERAKDRAFRNPSRGIEGIETRMMGRDAEHLIMQNIYRDAMEEKSTRIVTIVGEAGVGKSRLLYEFENWIELQPEHIYFLKGRATPELTENTYGPIKDAFSFRFEILESDDAKTVMRKLHSGMKGILEENQIDLVGHLVGFDFSTTDSVRNLLGSESFKEIAISYVVKYLEKVAKHPTVIFLEDIHFADDSSLDLISHLVQAVPKAPLLFVCLTRPVLFERRLHWGEGIASHIQLVLKPLTRRDSRSLVEEILKKAETIPENVKTLLIDGSEGNPFYLEELIKMLIEADIISRSEETWKISQDLLSESRIPSTLTGVLQARLDCLSKAEKAVLQRASVVGRLFWDEAVENLSETNRNKLAADDVSSILGVIRERELIFRKEHSAFEGSKEFIFKHALLRDVTYESVLLKLRKIYHRQVAMWLESKTEDRIGERFSMIANHYELAGENIKAAEYLVKAADALVRINAYHESVAKLNRALSLLPDDATKLRAEFLIKLGLTYNEMEKFHNGFECAKKGLELAADLLEPETKVFALCCIGRASATMGDYIKAQQYLGEGLAIAKSERFMNGIAFAYRWLGSVAWHQGNFKKTKKYAEEALSIFKNINDREGIASCHALLGNIASRMKKFSLSKQYYEESIAICREIGSEVHVANWIYNLGCIEVRQKNFLEANRYFQQSLVILQEMNLEDSANDVYGNMAYVYLELDDIERARENYYQSLKIAKKQKLVPSILGALNGFAELFEKTGQQRRSIGLLGLVIDHPALPALAKNQIKEQLSRLKKTVSKSEFDAAIETGSNSNLDDIVNEILKESEKQA